jgi:Thiol-activated cytolysin
MNVPRLSSPLIALTLLTLLMACNSAVPTSSSGSGTFPPAPPAEGGGGTPPTAPPAEGGGTPPVSPPDPTTPTAKKANVSLYLQSLKPWSELSPPVTTQDVPGKIEIKPAETTGNPGDDNVYNCKYTEFSLAQTPREIVVFQPDASAFWLGSLLQGSSYQIGSLKELSIRERAPLKIVIRPITGVSKTSTTVVNPTLSTVSESINSLLSTIKREKPSIPANLSYSFRKNNKIEESLLKLGLAVKFGGLNLSGKLDREHKVNENSIAAYFVQSAFTLSTEKPADSSAFFSDTFTEAKLKARIDAGDLSPTNRPAYISSVNYGRVLIFTMTSSSTEEEMSAAINFAYGSLQGSGGVNAELETKYKSILAGSEIRVTALGGEDTNARSLIANNDLKEYFKGSDDITSYVPISYEVKDVQTDEALYLGETYNYQQRSCTVNGKPQPQWKMINKKTITVPGTAENLDTGIVVQKGDKVIATSSGTISPGKSFFGVPFASNSPDGNNEKALENFPISSINKYGLIGSIGGRRLNIGGVFEKSFSSDADPSGKLLLGVNDDNLGDNSGEFVSTIEVWRYVDPAAQAISSPMSR